jgi:hypothetical protein
MRRFEFYFADLDALALVEEADGEVVVRATRDVFTSRRKEFFIRELASEGFIPDACRWTPLAEPGSFRGIRWVVDASWLRLPAAVLSRARRFVLRLWFSTAAAWVACVGGIVFHAHR